MSFVSVIITFLLDCKISTSQCRNVSSAQLKNDCNPKCFFSFNLQAFQGAAVVHLLVVLSPPYSEYPQADEAWVEMGW